VKRFLAPALGALVAVGALSIAPAQAAEPDGEQIEAVVLFGDATGNLGTEPEATRISLVAPSVNKDNNYSAYENGTAPSGQIQAQMPVDPAWFDSGSKITFTTPSNGSPGYATKAEVLLRYGTGWVKTSSVGAYVKYGSMGSQPDRERFISSGGGDLDVYVTRCTDGNWQQTGDPDTDPRDGWVCAGDGTVEEETQIVASTSPSPGGNGGSSGSGTGSSAPTLDLTLDPTETDATCSVAGVSGARGSWVTLEAASDCTPPPSTPDATLLGWATDPDFPVDIAQRQVDNGWGAYETYNDEGKLTSVFIPAGGAAQLTNSNTLYAIWSNASSGS